jgi:hypothetical protein
LEYACLIDEKPTSANPVKNKIWNGSAAISRKYSDEQIPTKQ